MSTFTRPAPRRLRGTTAAAAAVLALTGCTSVRHGEAVSLPGEKPAAESTTAPTPSALPDPTAKTALTESFAALPLPGGQVGVAITDGTTTWTFGDWSHGAAWSTIKVPMSIAAGRHAQAAGTDVPASDIAAAITQSDNAAADRLWKGLGGGEQAAAAVQEVLADAGDTATVVQSQQIHPPYSPFGQTDWSLVQAARLAFELPCLSGAAPVLTQMRQLGGNQQWGVANEANAAAKGGWGPDTSGQYLVRQLALVPSGDATIGVAMAAYPADGSFDTGTAMLNTMGHWFAEHRAELPAGNCQAPADSPTPQPTPSSTQQPTPSADESPYQQPAPSPAEPPAPSPDESPDQPPA